MNIAIRTTGVPIETFNKFLESEGCSDIIYNTEQPDDVQLHNHWLCTIHKELASFKKQRTRILKDYKGNQFVSIQVLKKTKDEYLAYMCKGYNVTKPYSAFRDKKQEPQVVGMLADSVSEYHEQFWSTYESMKTIQEDKKKSPTTGEKFLEYALPYCLDNGIEAHDRKEIARVTIRYFGFIAKSKFGKNIICEYMNLLTLHLDEEEFLNSSKLQRAGFLTAVLDMDQYRINVF